MIINESSELTEFDKVHREWTNVAEEMRRKIHHAKTFREFIKLNMEFLEKYNEYNNKMLACNDITYDQYEMVTKSNKRNIERAKEFSQLMGECEAMEATTRDFVKVLQKKFPGWEDLKDNPIVATPGNYLLEFYRMYVQNPNPSSASLSSAYRSWLRFQYDILDLQYSTLVSEGKIDPNKTVTLKSKEQETDS